LTDHSQEKVDSAGKALEAHFSDTRDIGSITTEDLVTFALERKKVVKAITVKRDLEVYSQACAAVGVTPAKLPGIGKTTSAPQQPFSLDEVRRFMVATSPQSRLLAYCLHFCGLRNSETRKLDEPEWENKRVWCKGTKTKGSKRWIFPPAEMWEYMVAQRQCGEWRGWPKLGKQGVLSFVIRTSIRAGLGHRHPNDCRGGFATRLAIAGVPAGVRGALMGNSEKTQTIYSQPQTDERALAEAMHQHPRIRPPACITDAATESATSAKTAAAGNVTPLKSLQIAPKTPEK
jgi:integrase